MHLKFCHIFMPQMRAGADACNEEGGAVDGGLVWSHEGIWCGEPLFVANSQGRGEDDGCVLSICYDAAESRSFLLVLQVTALGPLCTVPVRRSFVTPCLLAQASTMTELARAYAPVTIPLGLHSLYADIAASTLA